MKPLFSIIVVCLNPGEKLKVTLDSIMNQTYSNYEVIVKDGMSTDGSMEYARELQNKLAKQCLPEQVKNPSLRILQNKDTGIYDAMNQAVQEATGSMVYFLNCGDCFHSTRILEELAAKLILCKEDVICYGNIFERLTGQEVHSNPSMDAFGCYRNVPCHQACFYGRDLLLRHPFDLQYKVRADYEQFLWCFFEGKAKLQYTDMIICDYEGGGYSETKANAKVSAFEHSKICKIYLPFFKRFGYKLIMILTLAPVRTAIARNPKTAGLYNKFKKSLYRGKRQNNE